MEDLIYKFLIQSGFSRASIVTDVRSISTNAAVDEASFVIVDPDTTDCLAMVKVVGPVDADMLIDQSAVLARSTQSIGGQQAQGYVVRVDEKAVRDNEQVQFYRCFPNTQLQQITARTFPDLDTLKVNFKLTAKKPVVQPESVTIPNELETAAPRLTLGAYLPAVALLLLALCDWIANTFFGIQVLALTHSVLAVGGAVLLSVPALQRYMGAISNNRNGSSNDLQDI